MNAAAFRHFYAYHFHENRTLWDNYITALTPEQFPQTATYTSMTTPNRFSKEQLYDKI